MSLLGYHYAMRAALLLGVLAASASAEYRKVLVGRPGGAEIAAHVRDGSPMLVLIPGSWDEHRVFDRMVAGLPSTLGLVIVELRGHGASQPAARAPTMRMFAEDVLAVVDRLGLGRFHVGGHSIGGMVAIEVAGLRPGAVAGVIAIEGWTHHQVARDAFPPGRSDPVARERMRATMSEAEIVAFASVWRTWDGGPILASTPVPILEVWGDRGRPRPDRATMRIPDRPNIQLVWIDGASHRLLEERPEQVARAISGFVR
jgi:pimeloyl-ACP methyl ester carboxylesterase